MLLFCLLMSADQQPWANGHERKKNGEREEIKMEEESWHMRLFSLENQGLIQTGVDVLRVELGNFWKFLRHIVFFF